MKIKGYDRTTYSTSEKTPIKGETPGRISIVIRMLLNVLFRGKKNVSMPDDPPPSPAKDPNDAFVLEEDEASDE